VTVARNFPRNCGLATTASFARQFAKKTVSAEPLSLSARAAPVITALPTNQVQTVIGDRVVLRSSSTVYVDNVEALATRRNGYFDAVRFVSDTPAVVSGGAETQDGSYLFAYVADGVARLRAETKGGFQTAIAQVVSSGSASPDDVWANWNSGSLAESLVATFLSRANVAGRDMPIFSTMNHGASQYVVNQNCWLSDIDMSFISPWNSIGGQNRAGVLISPRHVLFCNHYPLAANATIRFVRTTGVGAGTVENRTITAVATNASLDFCVGLLDQPSETPFCKVLSAPINQYIPSMVYPRVNNYLSNFQPRLPLISTNQDKHIGYKSLIECATSWSSFNSGINVSGQTALVDYAHLQPYVRIGCSGHPVFLLIGAELALVGLYYGAGFGFGSFGSAAVHTAVNAMMTTLGGGHQLTAVDLSSFPTYA
jgi:hypothetical protein